MASVDLNVLLEALEFVSSVVGVEAAAFVSRDTGQILFVGDDLEPEGGLPGDLETSDRYVAVPSRQDLGLGRRMALSFAAARLGDDYQTVRSIFGQAGAYARFKDLLEARGQLAAWYEFENEAQRDALRDWCASEGLELVGTGQTSGPSQ